jgi:hypothetical protein
LPLDPLIGHIEGLIVKVDTLESELQKCPFSKVKGAIRDSIENYERGLRIIKGGLNNGIIERAKIIAQTKTKSGKTRSLEDVIYSYYQELVRASYGTAERFNSEITMLVRGSIPPELYHWLLEIPQCYQVEKPIVFEEGNRFVSETFSKRIISPVVSLIELARNPSVSGTLEQIKPIDLTESYPIKDGYIVSLIRGEVETPVLWPILCHEMFEIVDKEKHLFDQFKHFISREEKSLPTLDSDPASNEHWNLEIFMDFLAMSSFGPMYAKSLLEYFKRSPYYPTPSHPDASSRLFCVYKNLEDSSASIQSKTDILGKCQQRVRQELGDEIQTYELGGDLDGRKKENLSALLILLRKFLQTVQVPSFEKRLEAYIGQSGEAAKTLKEILNSPGVFIPFQDAALTFDDIRNNILSHHISLAIDPNIMLNVVLANYDRYSKTEHLSVIVDSIRKWKVKQAWNESAENLKGS